MEFNFQDREVKLDQLAANTSDSSRENDESIGSDTSFC